MADQIPANDAPAAEPVTPAVATPPVTIPNPDTILAAINAKLRAAAEAPPEKPKADPAKPDAPTLDIPPKVMKELGRLQTELRKHEGATKENETLKPDATLAREVRDLWTKGDGDSKLAALAKLSGKDGLDELAALVAFFYERDQQAAAPNADGTPKPSGELKAVLDRLDAVSKELAEIKGNKTTDAERATKAETEAAHKAAGDFVKRFVDGHKEQFELCAKPENADEATDLIQSAALKIVQRENIDSKTLTQEAADKIYLEACAEVESEFEKTGERFSKAAKKDTFVFNPDKYAPPRSRPTVTIKTEELSRDPRVREQQIKDRLQARLEAGEFSR